MASTEATASAWIGYYNIAETGFTVGGVGPFFPAVCELPVDEVMYYLRNAVRLGLSEDAVWVESDDVLRQNYAVLQPLHFGFLPNLVLRNNGWPHPNDAGQTQLASLVAQEIERA